MILVDIQHPSLIMNKGEKEVVLKYVTIWSSYLEKQWLVKAENERRQ